MSPSLRSAHSSLPASRGLTRSRLASLCVALLMAMVPLAPALASDVQASVPLVEGWRYRWGDSPVDGNGTPAWASQTGEEPEWQPMAALTLPPGRGTENVLWLSIPVPAGDWEDPGVLLARAVNAFETYSGGRRIYASGRLDPAGREHLEHFNWHLLRLPREALGQRLLFRLQSSDVSIGIAIDARVGSYRRLHASALRQEALGFTLGAVLVAVGLGMLVAFLRWRKQRLLFHGGLFAASAGLLVMGSSGVSGALWEARHTWFILQFVGGYFAAAGLWAYLEHALLRGRVRWARRLVGVLYAYAGVLALCALLMEEGIARTLNLFLLLSMGSQLGSLALAVFVARRGSVDARILSVGTAAYLVATVLTSLPAAGVLTWMGIVLHGGLLVLIVALLLILSRQAQKVVRTLEAHTHSLEAQHGQVRELADRMSSGAAQLSSAVGQLKQAGVQQNEGVQRQAASLHEAQTTVEELRQTSRLTAERAMVLAATAGEAGEIGREGAQTIERTLGALEAIRTEVGEMVKRLAAQEGRTREIASIVETVKGLADQSNMLALNAAIEAVRSGEHGKGFAVVAREVRSLADQSIQATERIREILQGVTTSSREAARLGAQGEERVRQSLEAVRESGEGLRRLAQLVGETGQSLQQMTAAISQQDAGTSQIATAIADLSGQMERTLGALQETDAVTRSVEALAEGMADVARQALQPGHA